MFANEFPIRRTASLDALYARPVWCRSLTGSVVVVAATHGTVLQLDKATQTDESYLEQRARDLDQQTLGLLRTDTPTDIKIEKVLRQRLQRGVRSGAENSVSSQTLSPVHGESSQSAYSTTALTLIISFSFYKQPKQRLC